MRWMNNLSRWRSLGTRITVKRFAFLPKDLDNGTTVWLESYLEVRELQRNFPYGREWIAIERKSV